jgi:hypothetical protein
MSVVVCVRTETLSQGGNITGQVFLAGDNWCFPENGWSDFPVIIIGWWLNDLKTLLHSGGTFECRFMDGPFLFRVSSVQEDQWLIECGRSDPEFSLEHSAQVMPHQFMSSLRSTAQSLIVACNNHGWRSSDIRRLYELCLPVVAGT